jgi:hypothetical protein
MYLDQQFGRAGVVIASKFSLIVETVPQFVLKDNADVVVLVSVALQFAFTLNR